MSTQSYFLHKSKGKAKGSKASIKEEIEEDIFLTNEETISFPEFPSSLQMAFQKSQSKDFVSVESTKPKKYFVKNLNIFVQIFFANETSISSCIERIIAFLSLADTIALMETCKRTYGNLMRHLWKSRLEAELRIDRLEYHPSNSPEFFREFYKGLHFSLESSKVLTSKTLLEAGKKELKILTKNLLHFEPITNPSLVKVFTRFAQQPPSKSLMASLKPAQNSVVLWVIDGKNDQLFPCILHIFEFPQNVKIQSVQFYTDKVLVVQTYEALHGDELNSIFRIRVIHIESLISNLLKDPLERIKLDDEFILEYKENSSNLPSIIPKNKDEHSKTLRISGKAPSEHFACFDWKERIYFYSKIPNPVIFPYNLKERSLEPAIVLESENSIRSSFIAKQKRQEGVQNIVLVKNDYSILVLHHNLNNLSFKFEDVPNPRKITVQNYSYKNMGLQDLQYGSFPPNHPNFGCEYIFFFTDGTFYFLRLDNYKIVYLYRFTPGSPNNPNCCWVVRDSLEKVALVRIKNWFAHRNQLGIVLDTSSIIVFEFNIFGHITQQMGGTQSIQSFSSWVPLPQKKLGLAQNQLVKTDIEYGMSVSECHSYFYMNDSYLILIILGSSQQFFINFASFTETILGSRLINWNELRKSELNLKKACWKISSHNEFFSENNQDKFFEIYGHNVFADLIQFKGNKLFINFGGMPLYMDLESKFNFSKKVVLGFPMHFMKQELDLEEVFKMMDEERKNLSRHLEKVKVSFPKNIYIKLKANLNHEDESQEIISLKERQKDFEEYKQEFRSEGSPSNPPNKFEKQKQKDERRKKIREMLSEANRVPEMAELANLKKDTKTKDWILRQMDKRKTKQKSTRRTEA